MTPLAFQLVLAQTGAAPADAVGSTGPSGVIAPYMAVFFVAFFVAFAFTPLMRMLATRNGVVDWPDLARKNHLQPVAYLGGVAIFLGWLAGVSLCFVSLPNHADLIGDYLSDVSFPPSLIIGAAIITLTGLFDDVYGISPRMKVGGQLFAAAALASQPMGLQLVDSSFQLVGVHLPITIVYILGTALVAFFVIGGCNAMNLLDGLDGLAAGVAAIACAGFLVIAALVAARSVGDTAPGDAIMHLLQDPKRIVMCLAILGALLGFLPYNFNPATIFMGDTGSLLIGYLCVAAMLLFAATPAGGLRLVTAALVVFAVPITDTSLAIFRRKMAGQPISAPDNRHIHHLLRRSGMSVRQSVLTIYAAAGCFALLGVAMVALDLRWRYMLAVFFVVYGFIMVTAYKYGQRQIFLDAHQKARHAEAQAEAQAITTAAQSLEHRV